MCRAPRGPLPGPALVLPEQHEVSSLMSLRRIALVAGLVAACLSLSGSPIIAAAPAPLVPDIGVSVTPIGANHATVRVSPWVWEPDAADSLRIAVGTRARRIVVRVWLGAGQQHGRFLEQRRVDGHWRTVSRAELSAADLAGGSTDPARTRYARAGFLAFDASIARGRGPWRPRLQRGRACEPASEHPLRSPRPADRPLEPPPTGRQRVISPVA